MQENCPNCQATLVPSVVGYLCSECGSVHRFYKTDPDINQNNEAGHQSNSPAAPHDKSASPHHKSSEKLSHQHNHAAQYDTNDDQIVQPSSSSTKHSNRHQQSPRPTDLSSQHNEGYSERSTITAAPSDDDHRGERTPNHPNLDDTHGHDQAQAIDQQALTEARHYRKKLRHRLKTMVVPELPSPYDKEKLNSSHSDQIATPLPPRPADSIPKYADPYHYKEAGDDHQDAPAKENLPSMTIDSVSTPHPLRNGLIIVLVVALLGGATFVIMQKRQNSNSNVSQAPALAPSNTPRASATKTNDDPDAVKRDDTRKKDLKEIATALEVYHRDNGSYPAGNDISALYPLQYTNPPYISYINYDPSSTESNKIKYGYSSDGVNFKLTAKLEILTDLDAQDGIYTVVNTKN